jgi:signal transduction histidine kinase/CheY-like chemotaxis protein
MAAQGMMMKITRHPLVRYGVAVLVVVAAFAALRMSGPGSGLGAILLFAVLFSAWFGGLGPGLLSTGLITLIVAMIVARLHRDGSANTLRIMVGIGLFTVGGVLVSWLLEALHLARRRAEENATLAQHREETLRQSEARERAARTEAEEANRIKDRFLAVLSHELRTPLTPILAAVTALLEEPVTSPEVRSALELTQWGIELESRLIEDLLDMTRITRGSLSLHPETTDAHRLLLRTEEICRAEMDAGKLILVRDHAAAEHHVEADPTRLQQVFWNLIKNAVKFSPGGGTLTVRTWNQHRSSSMNEPAVSELVIEITDTGIGIEPEVLPTIFDAFTQAEAGWVRRFGGLGLGLAISRSVIEAHGGRITATSAGKNQGATFHLYLPAVPAPARREPVSAIPASSSTSSPPASPLTMLKILLVEDDGPTLKVMTRLLGKPPYQVRTANTFAAALEAASAEDFDLIISDIGLPDGSGLELMRQIRDRYAARGIALSGYGMEEDIRRSREAGFLAHLTKPVDFQKLQGAIAQVLR